MDTQFRNALLIHNPNAGTRGNARRRLLDQARRILSGKGIEADLAETTGPGHATELAQDATRDRRQLVIACGGDGTLNEVHRVLRDVGVLTAALPSDGRNPIRICESHSWKTVPQEVLMRLERAGFVSIEIRELDPVRPHGERKRVFRVLDALPQPCPARLKQRDIEEFAPVSGNVCGHDLLPRRKGA
jgi:hypothetical protein